MNVIENTKVQKTLGKKSKQKSSLAFSVNILDFENIGWAEMNVKDFISFLHEY